MLELTRAFRTRRDRDDDGAALVAVVVVMLVGFVIASTIAASVLFTLQANTHNRGSTQAYIAAESGRDAALAYMKGHCNPASFPLTSSGSLIYSASIAVTDGDQPHSPTDPGVATGCPSATTRYVVITSKGTGADGSSTTVDAVYPWIVTWEQQAGGVLAYYASGVSLRGTYAGDIVVRSGNYTCAADGTLNGNLYVTRGTATFSRDCTVNGDIWSYGDVDGSSQQITVTGNVKAGGVDALGGTVAASVTFTSNGTAIGKSTDATSGNIEATKNINLTNTGSTNGHVWGSLKAGGAISVGNKWVTGPTTTQTPSTPPPAFDPTLEFIRSITAWMDLDKSSDWGVTAPNTITACGLSDAAVNSLLTTGGSDPVMLDYTSCGGVHQYMNLTGGTLNKDAIFVVAADKVADVTISGSLSGNHQVIFMHEDGSRNLVGGETSPTCNNGNQRDNLTVGTGLTLDTRVMMYTPCGINGTIKSSFKGQLYSNDTSGVTFIGSASYTCALMEWPPAFDKLGCKVRGGGDDSVIQTVQKQRIGDRLTQTEH